MQLDVQPGLGQRDAGRGGPEVQDIGEAVDAGVEPLVAAGMEAEETAGRDRVAHRREELDPLTQVGTTPSSLPQGPIDGSAQLTRRMRT